MDQSVALERNNGCRGHWVEACRHKSIIVFKSKAMVNRRIGLFAYLHVNDEARPETHRLSGVSLQRAVVAETALLRRVTLAVRSLPPAVEHQWPTADALPLI